MYVKVSPKAMKRKTGIKKKKSVSFKQEDPSNALRLCYFLFRDVFKELESPRSCRMLNHFRDQPWRPDMKLLLSFQF